MHTKQTLPTTNAHDEVDNWNMVQTPKFSTHNINQTWVQSLTSGPPGNSHLTTLGPKD